TVRDSLTIMADLAANIIVRPDNMRVAVMKGFATATDLADYLVKKGMAFRDAHEAVATAVRVAAQSQRGLEELSLEELRVFSPLIHDDVYAVLTPEGSAALRNHIGGTAPEQVRAAISRAKMRLLA
ncbi:MAG: argininosuccinate lyase, partial [Aeromicrobium sp.]|nr:argininosuccinate lyase [Burkholderiales bacterium]